MIECTNQDLVSDPVNIDIKRESFVIVTKDADFNDLSVIMGYPPYIVWLRTGNTRVRQIENTLRAYQERIEKMVGEGKYGIVEIKGS